jgi:protein gp37
MSTKSTIEWTEQTWNPATGCTKVTPGCLNCYAEAMARRLKGIGAKGYVEIHKDDELVFILKETAIDELKNALGVE